MTVMIVFYFGALCPQRILSFRQSDGLERTFSTFNQLIPSPSMPDILIPIFSGWSEDSVADCGGGGKSLTFYLVLFQLLLFSFLEIVFSGWSEGSGADCGRGEALYHPTSSHGTEQTNYYFG